MEKYEITGWTFWEDESYRDIKEVINIEEQNLLMKVIADYLKENDYYFSGETHQDSPVGVPIINNKYLARFSQRQWGTIVAISKGMDVKKDHLAYVEWAWRRVKTPSIKHMEYAEEKLPIKQKSDG